MRQRQEPEEAAQRAGEDGDRSGAQPDGIAPEVVLDVRRSQAIKRWRTLPETVFQEQAGVPQTVAARVVGEPAGLAEEPVVLGQERVMRGRGRRAVRRVASVEHAQQVVGRGAAADEVATEPPRARAVRQVLLEEEAGRGPRQVVGRHHGEPRPQPVAVVLGGPEILVDDVGRVAPSDQVVDIPIEDFAERVGPEPAEVMGASEDRLEHGCSPGEEKEPRGEHQDYAEPSQRVVGSVEAETSGRGAV